MNILRHFIRIPETPLKESVVRFLSEEKTERIVEIPAVLRHIPEKKSRILDVGCRYSLLSLQLASLGHDVYGNDINTYAQTHPNFTFLRGDIRDYEFNNLRFDIVTAISTIEHIGLGFYKDQNDLSGDQKAIDNIYRNLKSHGTLLMTVPFGIDSTNSWYRVYSLKRIRQLLHRFHSIRISAYYLKNDRWIPGENSKLERIDSSEKVKSVAIIVASKKI